MKKEEVKEFLEQFDLGWREDCFTIAKVTFEREIMEGKKNDNWKPKIKWRRKQ